MSYSNIQFVFLLQGSGQIARIAQKSVSTYTYNTKSTTFHVRNI